MHRDAFLTLPILSSPGCSRRIAYRLWGEEHNPNVVLCVHGLSRNGRDFDRVAERLCNRYAVICPDMAGRGQSDWLENKADYNYLTYISDICALLMQLNVTSVDWIGTSMGGIIGMMLAAQNPALVKRMILNDVGSIVSAEGLRRILNFVGVKSAYNSREEAMQALRHYLSPFGITDPADWEFMFSISFKPLAGGAYQFYYDPGITKSFQEAASATNVIVDVDLSAFWNVIQCPVLILRGKESDILHAATARSMLQRQPPTKLVEFEHVGHAPALLAENQIKEITEWLA